MTYIKTHRDRLRAGANLAVLTQHGITAALSTYYRDKACPVGEAMAEGGHAANGVKGYWD